MGPESGLILTLLCWAAGEVAAYPPWDFSWGDPASRGARADPHTWSWVEDPQSRAISSQQPVTVQCQEAQLVVTVHRDLFGTGRLVNPADLTLGPAACKHSSLNPAHNTVTFTAGLHECGSIVQITPDSLIYRTLLNYDPSPASNPIIIRSNPAVIPIECHYPRRENVSSNAIRPTWAPFSSMLSAEERLVFSLRLMNEDWSAERPFTGFQLGDVLNIQAEVGTESHVPLRLFVDSCVAALSPGTDSSPHYAIIDFNGCLVDGRSDDTSSAFITPRPREDVLRFRIDVFRFAGDARNLIYITCHLKVTPVDQAPDPLNKACSFNKARNTWAPVEGTRDICSCCETGNCESPALSRRLNPLDRWPGRRFRRHDANGKEAEADVVIGPVLLSRDPGAVGERQEGGQGGVMAVPGVGTGLICVAAGVGLAGAVLAVSVGRRRCARASEGQSRVRGTPAQPGKDPSSFGRACLGDPPPRGAPGRGSRRSPRGPRSPRGHRPRPRPPAGRWPGPWAGRSRRAAGRGRKGPGWGKERPPRLRGAQAAAGPGQLGGAPLTAWASGAAAGSRGCPGRSAPGAHSPAPASLPGTEPGPGGAAQPGEEAGAAAPSPAPACPGPADGRSSLASAPAPAPRSVVQLQPPGLYFSPSPTVPPALDSALPLQSVFQLQPYAMYFTSGSRIRLPAPALLSVFHLQPHNLYFISSPRVAISALAPPLHILFRFQPCCVYLSTSPCPTISISASALLLQLQLHTFPLTASG
ncbi:zona pellucida sperm-binding protein 3-like [Mycteria americana]|uniref:zona pellucida sperm-binding protein 3-like n=1 Tax=Mycteria americana TaxID=33587 RepID=UPI003F58C6EC